MDKIRPYNPLDKTRCVEIFNSNVPRFFDREEISGLYMWLRGQDEKQLAYKNTKAEYYYVAEKDDGVVACGGFYIQKEQPVANMTWGMVDRSLHKLGIGTKLFEFRLEQIRTHHPDCKIVLDTTQHTYGFFEKQGFKVTGIMKEYYGPGLDRYDMVIDVK